MKRTIPAVSISILVALLTVTVVNGCATGQTRHATSTVDYLYPNTKDPIVTPGIPVLTLPMRVGIAFVPGDGGGNYGRGLMAVRNQRFILTEKKKMDLMQEVANHFKKYAYVKDIELIPSAYLTPRGSFANLDQLRTMYGVDVVALLSYDQVQFTDEGILSFTYWTIIGAYVVPGERNDTHTMLDAVVYDIKSRKMLFRAPGTHHIKGKATLVNLSEKLRANSEEGFNEAAKGMITNLDQQLAVFKEKVKERPAEYKVVHSPSYSGGGNIDLIGSAMTLVLGGFFLWKRRRA
ncbi:MAG: rhombotarget lipoprotein [Sulfuricaulis sp.]|nr:rhombotarget lipoprotein [Sulfuricaulis sp.]